MLLVIKLFFLHWSRTTWIQATAENDPYLKQTDKLRDKLVQDHIKSKFFTFEPESGFSDIID